MIVPAPARPGGRLHFQNGVDHAQRILYDRITRIANAVAHELEKAGVDNVFRLVLILSAGRLIREDERARIRVFRAARIRIDPDVMARHPRHERSLCRDGPRIDVRLEKIRVLAHEPRGPRITSTLHQVGSADQRGNVDRESRRRVSGGFLPALLGRRGTFPDQKPARRRHHGCGVEPTQRVRPLEAPREHQRKGHLIELHARPVGTTIDPEILIEPSIRSL